MDPRAAIKDVLFRLYRRAESLNASYLAAWQCVTDAERIAVESALRATAVALRARAEELRAKDDSAGAASVAEAAEDIERALPRSEKERAV